MGLNTHRTQEKNPLFSAHRQKLLFEMYSNFRPTSRYLLCISASLCGGKKVSPRQRTRIVNTNCCVKKTQKMPAIELNLGIVPKFVMDNQVLFSCKESLSSLKFIGTQTLIAIGLSDHCREMSSTDYAYQNTNCIFSFYREIPDCK